MPYFLTTFAGWAIGASGGEIQKEKQQDGNRNDRKRRQCFKVPFVKQAEKSKPRQDESFHFPLPCGAFSNSEVFHASGYFQRHLLSG
jgi:hypothetical protein